MLLPWWSVLDLVPVMFLLLGLTLRVLPPRRDDVGVLQLPRGLRPPTLILPWYIPVLLLMVRGVGTLPRMPRLMRVGRLLVLLTLWSLTSCLGHGFRCLKAGVLCSLTPARWSTLLILTVPVPCSPYRVWKLPGVARTTLRPLRGAFGACQYSDPVMPAYLRPLRM